MERFLIAMRQPYCLLISVDFFKARYLLCILTNWIKHIKWTWKEHARKIEAYQCIYFIYHKQGKGIKCSQWNSLQSWSKGKKVTVHQQNNKYNKKVKEMSSVQRSSTKCRPNSMSIKVAQSKWKGPYLQHGGFLFFFSSFFGCLRVAFSEVFSQTTHTCPA